MRKTEKRDVEVEICDFCGEETKHLSRCVICKREMCSKGGGKVHAAFSVKIYKYDNDGRLEHSHICRDCSAKELHGITIQALLDGMMGKDPVILNLPRQQE